MLFRAPPLCALRGNPLLSFGLLAGLSITLAGLRTRAADVDDARKLYFRGKYEDCMKAASDGADDQPRDEDWPILLNQCLLTLGRYRDAQTAVSNALERMPWSIRIRLAARETYLRNGDPERAKELLTEINDRASTRSIAYRDSVNLVTIGQAALLLGADPRRVLDNLLNRVKKADPACREVYLAIGQLALDKGDFELAGKTFQEGSEKFSDDPEMLYGWAKSYANGDRAEMMTLLEKVLNLNERHVPTLLLLADHLIDAEEYKKADETLDKVLTVNPHEPDAWAYRAVLADLRNEPAQEKTARDTALTSWKTNPRVDFLIGEKLSQKYRFAEGSSYQRRALSSDENYLPAKGQLAQDLLRLGQEEEGWALAEDVYKQDGYDVLAYNLVTLHDTLAKFQVLTNNDFKVKMSSHEAAVYGDQVTNLLERARHTLCQKYGLDLTNRTTVEVFPEQKDFAIRTFGMPGGEGYLGVCFGNVITANSPASHVTERINWESVLWHEFCHVITLGLTKNKMPRWLSEGISVYEERQANPAWGQGMTPRYREMVLKGELTPVSNLSGAFLAPKTPMHLQFAYYESSLVIEFLVDRFGLDSLKRVLHDLGEGKSINDALEANTMPLSKLDKEFSAFARDRAENLAKGLEWSEPTEEDLEKGKDSWIAHHPKSVWSLTEQAKKLLAEKKWTEAKEPAQKLVDLYPEGTGGNSGYWLLAQAYHGLNQTNDEQAILVKLARLDGESIETYQRLMDLDAANKDWPAVARNAQRFLAVNPLVPPPYRSLAQADEALGKIPQALHAYQTLLLLDPPDPADLHYHTARLLYQLGDPAAKRQVLEALEEAPRFRDAHRLLLKIADNQKTSAANGDLPTPSSTPAFQDAAPPAKSDNSKSDGR
jgi:tetratricopeptide (TPR) repeat protein